jgi:tetratricopeptide (TPR) repeat protein
VPTAAEMYALALHFHRTGNLLQAEQLYRQVLQTDEAHADSYHMLGVLASQMGRHDVGIASIRHALTLNSTAADYHSNLGLALQAQGQIDDAVTQYVEALRIRPSFPEAHTCLANALHQQGKLDEAVAHCREALRLRRKYPPALVNLGNALLDQGKVEEAVDCFQQALGVDPELAEAHSNLGSALTRQDKLQEAVASYREALRQKPNYAGAHYNLGTVFQMQGQLNDALASYEQALRSDGQFADAHFNRALLWLLQGNWAAGWAEYEWRWAQHKFARRNFAQPLWDGGDLGGRSILLHAEQGLGDTIQFMRYVPLVKPHNGHVILECPPALTPLLRGYHRCDQLVAHGAALPAFDVQAPLLSLPGIFRTTLETIPATVPYLHANTGLVEKWRQKMCDLRGSMCDVKKTPSDIEPRTSNVEHAFRVGIAWQGAPGFRHDDRRSIALTQFAPLARVEGIQLVSLQKGAGVDQLRALAGLFPVSVLSDSLDEAAGAFMDTAAVMRNLDLVVSSDTAIAHLAGALGVPVWVALPLVPDWRWLLERPDSPWYPTMRLFRQNCYGDWHSVFENMANELRNAQVQKR